VLDLTVFISLLMTFVASACHARSVKVRGASITWLQWLVLMRS
jgi:hypothetical protein